MTEDDEVGEVDGEAVGAEASSAVDGRTAAERMNVSTAPLKVGPDGALTMMRAERFALHMAEGLAERAAWKAAGEDNSGGRPIAQRKQWVGDAVFLARVEALMDERRRLWCDGAQGEAMWAAKQAYRVARMSNETALVMRSAELIARIAERMTPSPEAGAGAGAAAPSGNGPGRPAHEPRRLKVDAAGIRSRLVGMPGVPGVAG